MELAERIASRAAELAGEVEQLRKQLAGAEHELERLVIAGQVIAQLTADDAAARARVCRSNIELHGGAAGAPDVVPQDVRIDHHGRRPEQDVPRKRALGTGELDGRDRTVLVHVDGRATDKLRHILCGLENVPHAAQATQRGSSSDGLTCRRASRGSTTGQRPGFRPTRPLRPLPPPITGPGQIPHLDIRRRQRLGGILNEYDHAA
jgi:hypothetical protein